MFTVTSDTLNKAYKPFDVVTDADGNVGFIQEVSVNSCQSDPRYQISYAVSWIVGNQHKVAWFDRDELTVHTNLFLKIAECACHPHGRNDRWLGRLFGGGSLQM